MGFLDPINSMGESGIDVLLCGRVCTARPDPGALRTPGRPPCTVVVDREDDVRFTRTALAAHAPLAGHTVVHPTVARGGRLLWHDILLALDHRPRPTPTTGEAQQRTVRAALGAAGPGRLTVLRAHRIGVGLWADLVHLHRTTHTDVVLVHHAELPDDLAHLLRHCDHRIVTTLAGMEELHPPESVSART